VVVIDPELRLLLFRFEDADTGYGWWATPGGGLMPGETHEEAARRELREEAGLEELELSPCIWVREHVFPLRGRWYRQMERYFLARVPAFEVRYSLSEEERVAEMLGEHRWWTLEEIDASPERIAPEGFSGLVRSLLANGPPREPITIGV
jgi:ADP-ribose pyrophosphatase YjhB (NUDIX family)